MTRLFLTTAVLSVLSFSAIAADLPSRVMTVAPTSAAPLFSWTGFYAGGNVGGGWKRTAQFFPGQNYLYAGSPTSDPDEDVGSNVSSAFIGGLQAGYDHQMGSWVFGVQANVEATSMNAVNSWPSDPDENVSSKAKAVGSFTGRVGYVIQPSLLVYAKGGIGWSRVNYSDYNVTVPYSLNASATHWGWTVGAGLEYALTSNWSTFIEYNHADYGSKNVTLTDAAKQNSWYYKFSNRIDTVMVGVNCRFGKKEIFKQSIRKGSAHHRALFRLEMA